MSVEEQQEKKQSRPADPGTAMRVTKAALEQMATFTGHDADSVSGLEPTGDGDGWRFQIEIVELERIPQSTTVMGSYEVHADADGNVVSYQRIRRYCRNQADILR